VDSFKAADWLGGLLSVSQLVAIAAICQFYFYSFSVSPRPIRFQPRAAHFPTPFPKLIYRFIFHVIVSFFSSFFLFVLTSRQVDGIFAVHFPAMATVSSLGHRVHCASISLVASFAFLLLFSINAFHGC
jgi:hypothetical protein